MPLSAEDVVAASNAWVWIPEFAETAETDDYLLIRFPDYFDHPLELVRFTPAGPDPDVAAAVDMVLDKAREYGLPRIHWLIRLDSPPGVAELLIERGATHHVTLDVLASDLTDGAAELPPPEGEVAIRWGTDAATQRDGSVLGATVFGGSPPPEERNAENAAKDSESVPAGGGGLLVGYDAGGKPVACGGVTVVDGVARLWGGAVLAEARGRGYYRAVLNARLRYAVAHGARLALVKGNIATSGPILRRARFTAYGEEQIFRVPL